MKLIDLARRAGGGSGAYRLLVRWIDRFLNIAIRLKGIDVPTGWLTTRAKADLVLDRWEIETTHVLAQLIGKGAVALDIGANVGLFSRFFSRFVGPTGRVYAFEPDPDSLRSLRKNTGHLENVHVIAKAAADKNSTVTFYRNSLSGTLSSLTRTQDTSEAIEVEAITIDEFCSEAGLARVDVAKIDVEGAEPLVLRGMRKTIAANPDLVLVVEFCPKNYQASQLEPADLLRGLAGFKLEALMPDGLIPIHNEAELLPLLNAIIT